MQFFVYILECADTTYYTGCTNNITKRLKEHNTSKKGAKYTKTRRPVVLKHSEIYTTLLDARRREAAIKKLPKKQKQLLFIHV